MLRALTVAAMLTALTLVATTVGAQSPEPIPTATADQIVFFGEVPAPPGTTVTVMYIVLNTPDSESELVVCGSTTSTESGSGDADTSSFVVISDTSCSARRIAGPSICWAEDVCQPVLTNPSGGDTVDVGLLVLNDPSEPPLIPPHGDGGDAQPDGGGGDAQPDGGATEIAQPDGGGGDAEIALPDTGAGTGQGRAKIGWLLWAGVTLLAAGLAIGGMSLAVRRKS